MDSQFLILPQVSTPSHPGVTWMVNLRHIVAFAPSPGSAHTHVELVSGKSILVDLPIEKVVPNYPKRDVVDVEIKKDEGK